MSSSRLSAHLAPAAVTSPADKSRSAGSNHPVTRGRRPRPPRPLTPADFFTPERFAQLVNLLANCALRWRESDLPYMPFFWQDSAPCWGAAARRPCSGTTIRLVRLDLLRRLLRMEVERGLRLLLLDWRPVGLEREGHSSEEWQDALTGTLWRVGQLYREFARRWDEGRAWQEIEEVIRILAFCVTADAA
jgi:hypothetical protein